MDLDRNVETAVDAERVVIPAHDAGSRHAVGAAAIAVGRDVVADERTRGVGQALVGDVLLLLRIHIENGRRQPISVPHLKQHIVDLDDRAAARRGQKGAGSRRPRAQRLHIGAVGGIEADGQQAVEGERRIARAIGRDGAIAVAGRWPEAPRTPRC